jgi:Protein of unknown function (DUF2934)
MSASVNPTSRGQSRPGTSFASVSNVREASTPEHRLAVCHPAALGWREEMIRRTAYLRSQRRAPCSGKELEDWLAAEREIDQLIACGGAPYA